MIKYSLTNCDSTIGENIRYLMHKYKFDMHQWYGFITPLFNKIDSYIASYTVIENRCKCMTHAYNNNNNYYLFQTLVHVHNKT